MHDDRAVTEGRLDRFRRDHIEPALYREGTQLDVRRWAVPGEPVPPAEALRAEYEPFAIGTVWGAPWSTSWFRLSGCVPTEWAQAPDTRVEVVVDLGFGGPGGTAPGFQTEGLAFDPSGVPIKAITPRNRHVPISLPVDDVVLFVEAAANPDVAGGWTFLPTRLGDRDTAGDAPLYRLAQAELALLDVTVWELLQDVSTLDGLMRQLPLDSSRRAQILRSLERMLDVLDPDDIAATAQAGRDQMRASLARPAHASAHRIHAVGHAHLDTAWLWPTRETVRKCARTFANALALMDDEPDFVFACSSAQQLAWTKAHYPQLFERIRARVRTGQFRPVGGMWVESDTNLPGGEAMARQFVAGKRFFLEEFGVDCEEVWLPDSFGYSASLPGICAAAGARWFLTQKISWNRTNRMPHHTFRWEGIDGTQLLTHFPPVDTYGSDLGAADLAHAERNFADKASATMSLVPFGWGDGGGGPTREMIAAARRASDLEGSPRVRLSDPQTFFEAAAADYPDPPVWSGELYLEMHRGTYTSQARTKLGNRRSEHLLREAELWAATAAVRHGADYPYELLERCWQTVLLQQFHDILPGSSIAWVYREAERNYARVQRDLEQLIARSTAHLAGGGDRAIVFNATPHSVSGVAALGAGIAAAADGQDVRLERASGRIVLDNGVLRAGFDDHGLLVELYDHAADRQVLAPGSAGNLLQLHRDIPNAWDAWDVDAHYRRVVDDVIEVDSMSADGGPDEASIRITRRAGRSSFVQEVSLRRGAPSLDITTTVDWHERQRLLKLAFAFDVHADRSAAETQFGHVFRPTHTNTSWDAAKFEICAHRWVHVGEARYGVAMANDATYGHDVRRSTRPDGGTTTTVRTSLLRAPLFPDPEADQGEHTLRFSVRPGADIAAAVEEGYRVNLPLRTVTGGHAVAPLLTVSDPAVVVEAVKLAEDRSGDLVVRLYESLGGRARARIETDFDFVGVLCTDLLERPSGSGGLANDGCVVELELRPFQIVTLRFTGLPQNWP